MQNESLGAYHTVGEHALVREFTSTTEVHV